MSDSQAGMTAARWALLASVAVACGLVSPAVGDPAGGARLMLRAFPGVAPGDAVKIETVSFADPRRAPVQVVRGVARSEDASAAIEILGFGDAGAQQVRVVRGPVARLDLPWLRRVETVSFAEPGQSPVMVVRGGLVRPFAVALFNSAASGELDRIAFAVDGVESSHGRNPLMWRTDPDGPQGPMQVSLKAALDVGGGDRFDLRENRLLGRAYLAQMFRRYGNWTDALAAYNWGPGNVDSWIADGRPSERLPSETFRYVRRVLRDALVASAGRW
jgi:transglycosylase-like protein with SLT domain